MTVDRIHRFEHCNLDDCYRTRCPDWSNLLTKGAVFAWRYGSVVEAARIDCCFIPMPDPLGSRGGPALRLDSRRGRRLGKAVARAPEVTGGAVFGLRSGGEDDDERANGDWRDN